MGPFEIFIPIIAIIMSLGSSILLIYLFFTTRHKERMRLIDTGQSAGLFDGGDGGYGALKKGAFLVGGGLGILAGTLLVESGLEEGPSYLSMIALFSGLGLLVAHWLIQKRKDKAA
ncbi:hypothetical protein N8482_01470 [Chitinophagales bacterium]|nr:hypothetical protein [Chitinophagales bacterium]